jgi:uncharacterized protein YdeI (YjbR/CyaY-like superfamily)
MKDAIESAHMGHPDFRVHGRIFATLFEAQPPSYRKAVGWWVVSAKKEETRLKRLENLIEASARGRRVT